MPHIWRPSIDNMTKLDQLHTIVDNSSIISRVIFICARRSWFFFIICTNIEMLTYKCKFGYAIKDFDLDRYLVYELYWHGKKKGTNTIISINFQVNTKFCKVQISLPVLLHFSSHYEPARSLSSIMHLFAIF